MSCKTEHTNIKGALTLIGKKGDITIEKPLEGCEKKTAKNHNGIYIKTLEWVKGEVVNFFKIIKNQ